MSTRDISNSLQAEPAAAGPAPPAQVGMIRLVAQVLPGGVHQFEGVADVVTGELPSRLTTSPPTITVSTSAGPLRGP